MCFPLCYELPSYARVRPCFAVIRAGSIAQRSGSKYSLAGIFSRSTGDQHRRTNEYLSILSILPLRSLRGLSLHRPKMQRVPEVLQLSVIVERARPLSLEPQPSQEFNLVSGHVTAERSILKEFRESWLFLWREPGFSFDELESFRMPGR